MNDFLAEHTRRQFLARNTKGIGGVVVEPREAAR
jgi:hypothetical protein